MSLNELTRRVQHLPPLPQVVKKLIAMCQDPDVASRDIVEVIQLDPSLTLKVLHLSNSPFYGVPRTVTSLRDAVVFLGADAIANYVISGCLAQYQERKTRGYSLNSGEPWRHAVASAVCAQIVAERCEASLGPRAFACGLLHDVGKTVLDACNDAERRLIGPVLEKHGDGLLETERGIVGFDHALAGATLAAHWCLPEERVEAIRWHHDPIRCQRYRQLTCLVHVGNVLSIGLGTGVPVEDLALRLQTSALKVLGMTVPDLQRLLPRMEQRLAAALGMLRTT